jgi:hypothetical protein
MNHYEPIVRLTKKEQTMLRNRKYRESAKAEEIKDKDRYRKRKHNAEKEEKKKK